MSAPTTFVDELRRHAEQTPHALALGDPSGSISYAQLWEAVRAVAGWLRSRGVGEGDRVAIALPGSVANLVVMFAAMASGGVAAPVNTSLRRAELTDYLNRVQATLALVGADLRDVVDPGAVGAVEILRTPEGRQGPLALLDSLVRHRADDTAPDVDPDAPAIMFGTGGTTGIPKAAVWSHRGMWLYAASCAAQMEVRRTDVELFFSPQFHVALLTGPFGTLFSGGAVEVLPQFDAGLVAGMLAEGRITRFFGAPTALARIIRAPGFDPRRMGSVRRVLFGSTRSEPDLPDRLASAFPQAEFITGYGATEFGAVIRLRSWEVLPGHDPGVGKAVPGVRILVVGADDEALPVGDVGELVVCAPWQMLGYWGAGPDASRAFVHGGVRSGDLGFRAQDGTIHLRGRSKDIVITGGENVFPVEVEDVLSAHPAVAEASVVGVLDPEWGERVEAAVVLLDPAEAPSSAELTSFCRARLAGYKVPKRFHVVDALPLTGAMKVDKRALRELLADA